MANKVISPAYSFKGWNISSWFLGNWTTIKEFGKVLVPALLAWAATNNPALTGIITIIGKFLLDCGEYYVKQHTA